MSTSGYRFPCAFPGTTALSTSSPALGARFLFALLSALLAGTAFAQPPDPNIDDVTLNEVLFNPHDLAPITNAGQNCDGDGTAGEDGNAGAHDEFVELFNTGGDDVDLGGYCLARVVLMDGDSSPAQRWIIPDGETISAGDFWYVCGGDNSLGFGFSEADANGDSINAFQNSGSNRAVTLFQPSTAGDCGSGVDTVVFSIVYPTDEAAGESYKRCPDDGTSALGYYDDANGDFYAPTPGATNCSVATPAVLGSFSVDSRGLGSHLEWTTTLEAGVVGFDVYVGDRAAKRLNEAVIPAHGALRTYRFETDRAIVDPVWLAVIEVDGRRRWFGPYPPDQPIQARHATPVAIDWRAASADRDDTGRDLSRSADSIVEGGPLAEIRVDEAGVHRVTYEQLLAAGIDLADLPSDALALVERGGPAQPIHVEGGATFGPGSFFDFVGRPVDSLYTRTRVYQLLEDAPRAARIAVDPTPPPAGEPAPYYRHKASSERDIEYSFAAPNGDPWFETRILSGRSEEFEIEVDGRSESPAEALVTIELWGGLDWPETNPDHHVTIELNGEPVGELWFDGIQTATLNTRVDAASILNGVNTLRITVPGDTGTEFDLVHVDRYAITFGRTFTAIDGRLQFEATGNRFEIEGLSSPEALALRLGRDGRATLLAGAEAVESRGSFTLRLPGSESAAKYIVSTVDGLLVPDVDAPPADDLPQSDAELLILTESTFVDRLAPFAATRAAEGWSVAIVDIKDVFSASNAAADVDPRALRDYLASARAKLGTAYVLIVGADTYDYLDHLSLSSRSFVPTPYVATDSIVRFAPVDSIYGELGGDLAPELAVGRWPVRTVEELDRVIDKTLRYAASATPRSALLAADRAEGLSFAEASELWADTLPADWEIETAYVDSEGVEGARRALLDALDEGPALATYFGHSSPTTWSNDALLAVDDVLALANVDPTLVVQWGCWNTYSVEPRYETLGSAFLVGTDGGAAAVIGTSTLAQAGPQSELAELLMRYLTTPGETLGSAIVRAKTDFAARYPSRRDVLLGLTLLGDPTLELRR